MRRVVVTGMGIVSSIGNNTQEVLARCAKAGPAWCAAEDYAKLGFRCQVHGAPTLDPAEHRRPARDALPGRRRGLEPRRHGSGDPRLRARARRSLQRTHRHRHGLGRPVDRTIVEAADITRSKGPKRVGPFAVPKAMSSTASATLATWFKIKGVNYSISVGLRDLQHLHRQRLRADPVGQAGHHLRRRLRGARLDALGAVRRAWAPCRRATTTGLRWPRAPMTRTATASSSPAAPASWCWKNSSMPRRVARASMAKSSATAPPPTATTWCSLPAKARRAACGWRSPTSKATIDYINPHATSTPIGDLKEIEAIREVFGSGDKCPPISATKSLTGHSLGATGVHEAIYSLLMMQNGFICDSANIDELDPGLRRHAHRPQARRRCEARTRSVERFRLRRHQRLDRSEACRRMTRSVQALMIGQARPHHGGRQRPFHRLGHRPGCARAGRGARLHLSGRGARQARAAARRSRSAPSSSCPATSRITASVDRVFAELKQRLGRARFRRARHRLLRQERAQGPLRRYYRARTSSAPCWFPASPSPRSPSAPAT